MASPLSPFRRDVPTDLLSLSDVLSRAEVGILHRDLALNVLAVNDCYCRLVGRSREDLAGVLMETFTHPDDALQSRLLFDRHFATGEPLQIEKRYVRPDGSIRWCVVHVVFLRGNDGRITSTITVARDVTARNDALSKLRESEEHYRKTVELAPQITWTASPAGSIESVSPRWQQLTGMPIEAALGTAWIGALHSQDVGPTVQAWTRALQTGHPVDVEYRLRSSEGDFRWFRARAAARRDDRGDILRWYGTLEDVHDRKLAEQALTESEERFRLAAQTALLGIWDYDATLDRRAWSDELRAMLGLPATARPDVGTVLALVAPEDRHKLKSLARAVDAGAPDIDLGVTLRIHRANDGAERIMETSGWCTQTRTGQIERVLVTIRDVTEEKTAEQRIRWAATHDAFTGLPNRSHFAAQLDAAIARAEARGVSIALILLDVDNLKQLNDTIGHDAGDHLLQIFAQRLSDWAGDTFSLGRLGGDEFAAFGEFEDEGDITASVQEALSRLRVPFDHEGATFDCQATAGCSILPRDARCAADLLKTADIALYVGKSRHRGALSMFRPEMRANLERRASMLGYARAAVRDGRVLPYYQPKVVLEGGAIAGFEALLRWWDERGEMRSPDGIAAAFEDLSLATALGERMLDQVCEDIASWRARGLQFGRIALNLSTAEFRRDDLFPRIMERLRRQDIPTSFLELEVTETVLLGRGENVGETLAAFHREGVHIALDDFGTGHASLTHLQAFPVDVIKIDRSFVSNILTRPADAIIVKAITSLATDLGMEVVAEGVETAQQADLLRGMGCPFGQGFLYGAASAAEEVAAMMRPIVRKHVRPGAQDATSD